MSSGLPISDVEPGQARKQWTVDEARALYEAPFNDLLFRAHCVHRENFDPNRVQLSRLLNIKTGGCPEDCGYCSQSARYHTGLKATKLMEVERVVEKRARHATPAPRVTAWAPPAEPKERDLDALAAMVAGVKALGMETCMTLGMLDVEQAQQLGEAGLDYYNHNIDTSERYYSEIITTRSFADRLETLAHVRDSGIKVCSGGIIGMGETRRRSRRDAGDARQSLGPSGKRADQHAHSDDGTPLAQAAPIEPIEFVRTIALARILMPQSFVRLSAGRSAMSDEMQALCFFAGANSIFIGDTLLTAGNPDQDKDHALFSRLGIEPLELHDREKAASA